MGPLPPEPMRDLGVLGGFSSYGMAINGNKHVAGYSTINNSDERVHAFLHDGKSLIDLGSFGQSGRESDGSVALGVNNQDQVVGWTYLPVPGKMPLQQVAFLWRRNIKGWGGREQFLQSKSQFTLSGSHQGTVGFSQKMNKSQGGNRLCNI